MAAGPAPAARSGRATRGVVGAVVFAVAVASFSRVPLLPEIGTDLSLSAGEVGLLTTAFGLGRLVMDLPAGRLADAIDPILVLAVAGITLALSAGMLAAASTFALAMLASGLIGCATAVTNTTGMYAFATATAARRRGASMALYTTALMSGQMLGPAIGGVLAALTDWRVAIALAAGIGAAVALVCGTRWERAGRPLWIGAHADAARRAALGDPPGPPARRLELLALASVPFATFFGIAGLTQTLIPLVGAGELGLSTSTIGLAIGGAVAARFVSAWSAGVGSDRWSRKAVLVPLLVVMLAGALLLALPLGTGTWLASIVALAIGSAGISVAAAALADRVDGERLGHELGLFRLLGDLGLLVGPAVSAFLYQEVDARAAAFATAVVFGLALVSTLLWVHGSRGSHALAPPDA